MYIINSIVIIVSQIFSQRKGLVGKAVVQLDGKVAQLRGNIITVIIYYHLSSFAITISSFAITISSFVIICHHLSSFVTIHHHRSSIIFFLKQQLVLSLLIRLYT